MEWYIRLVETGLIPDWLIRLGIRRLLANHLKIYRTMSVEEWAERFSRIRETFSNGPIAVAVEKANEQHYELPPDFFTLFLGPHMKYSCGYWTERANSPTETTPGAKGTGSTGLAGSEEAMLELTCSRAQVEDGQTILDLGCGWGALGLYIAEQFPNSVVVTVSGSKDQAGYINGQKEHRGITNLTTRTADINDFHPEQKFDRIISVEMFEHMKNYRELTARVADWLKPGGKLFVHIFSHREFCYEYTDSWMARTFFSGGTMPSDDLLLYFQEQLHIEKHWRVSGLHYKKTLRAWLDRFDGNRGRIMPVLVRAYGEKDAARWRVYWRLFFMACEETFGLDGGNEYIVSHYLFGKPVAEH